MRVYILAVDTPTPIKLALAKGGVSVDGALHTIDLEEAFLTPIDGWQSILADLERIVAAKRPEPEPVYQEPPSSALPLEGGSSVPAVLRDDPDAWRNEIGEVDF